MNTTYLKKEVCAMILLASGVLASRASVTYWRVDKGIDYLQTADNTQPPAPASFYFYADLGTDLPGDATQAVITGGNIAGSMAFAQNGNDWEVYVDYVTKAELDAVFPSEAGYSIILSGGSLGTVTQQFSIAADDYPSEPYLSGADYSTFQSLDVFEPFEVNWNLPAEPISSVGFEITEGIFPTDGDTVVDLFPGNTFTNAFLAGDFFAAGSNYSGFLQFSNSTNANGSGGFGVDGITAFNSEAVFPINAVNPAIAFDDFNDNGMNTNQWIPLFADGDTFAETNNRLEYTSAGTGDTFVAWGALMSLSYTQNWAIAIDVTDSIPAGAFGPGAETYFGILVAPEGDIADNISAEFINSANGREVATYASSNDEEVLTNTYDAVSVETVTLKISFDADTKLLHTAYSTGGDFVVQTNYAASSWGMTDSSYFLCAAFSGNSNAPVSAGQIYADNFRVYDGMVLSNEVKLVELEFLHSYGDGTIFLEGNFVNIEADSSHRVISMDVVTSGGDTFSIPLVAVHGATTRWDAEIGFPFIELWDPANDGDWLITFGLNDGTFQSTVIPFTLEDGTTPIPDFYNKPLFISPSPANGLVTSSNTFSFAWQPAVPNALYVSVDEIVNGNEIGDLSMLFTNGLSAESLALVGETNAQPISITSTGSFAFAEGFHRMRINEGSGHIAYNNEGVLYTVTKQNESDIIFTITDDVDFDNMPDDWETEFFGGTSVVNGGANDDFDEDGFSNLEEFIAGINPTNSSSVFAVEEPGPSPAGFVINWNSVEGRKYAVYWAKTLSDGFDPVTPGYLPYPINSYTDTVHTVEGCGFYYIDVQLQN